MDKQKQQCTEDCHKGSSKRMMTCKLTSPELQQRKAITIASLKRQVTEKKEITNGYSYRFLGTDKVLDELLTFIKTERICCDFFDFKLDVASDASEAWLSISGPDGTKKFIDAELEF